MLTTQDERMLSRMGITSQDPHADCMAKWLQEREARCAAEREVHRLWDLITAKNNQLDAMDNSRTRRTLVAWLFFILSGAMAIYIKLHLTY